MTYRLIPVPEAVDPDIAAHNTIHDKGYRDFWSHHLCATRNGYEHRDTERVVELLRHTADLIEQHPDDPIIMADAYCFLHNSGFLLRMEAWCVMKVYYRQTDGFPPDSVVIGCVTQDQAERFASKIAEFYRVKYAGNRDTFEVRREWCHPYDMIREDTDPKVMLASWGR